MRACPALRPRRDLHVRPWVYGKSGPRLRTFRRTRLPRTMPASLLANIPTTSRYCLPYIHTTSAPTTNLFRGSITQPAHSLSTLHNMGYPNAAQDSLPAGGQPLPGGIGYPLGPTTRFQQCLITASPLSKLSWRTWIKVCNMQFRTYQIGLHISAWTKFKSTTLRNLSFAD
jgi:hypothetical protein